MNDRIFQLEDRIEQLEKMLAALQADHLSRMEPFKEVFVADVNTDGTWTESVPQTDGTTVEFNDGRAGSSTETKAIELTDASVLLQVPNGRSYRFVKIGSGEKLPVGQYQYMVYQVTASNVAGWDFTRAHP